MIKARISKNLATGSLGFYSPYPIVNIDTMTIQAAF